MIIFFSEHKLNIFLNKEPAEDVDPIEFIGATKSKDGIPGLEVVENTEKEKPNETKRMILTEEDKQKLAKVIHGSEDEDEETEPIPAKKPRTETSNTNEKPGENIYYNNGIFPKSHYHKILPNNFEILKI